MVRTVDQRARSIIMLILPTRTPARPEPEMIALISKHDFFLKLLSKSYLFSSGKGGPLWRTPESIQNQLILARTHANMNKYSTGKSIYACCNAYANVKKSYRLWSCTCICSWAYACYNGPNGRSKSSQHNHAHPTDSDTDTSRARNDRLDFKAWFLFKVAFNKLICSAPAREDHFDERRNP